MDYSKGGREGLKYVLFFFYLFFLRPPLLLFVALSGEKATAPGELY